MLVLSRKCGDAIWIGDQVRLTVLKIERSCVRLGLVAPDGVSILREELIIDREDRDAKRAWEAPVSAPSPQ